MDVLQQFKCPCCDGAIEFDSTVQKMKCPYCGTEFEIEALLAYEDALNQPQDSMTWDTGAGSEWQEGETEGYSAADHLKALLRHGGAADVCLYNTKEIPEKLAARYMPEGSEPLMPDATAFRELGVRLFGGDMLSRNGQLARHDPLRLAYNVMLCAETYAHREGALGDYDRLLLRKG